MNTMLVILSAINILQPSAATLLKQENLTCLAGELDIKGIVAVSVTCNTEVDSKIAIGFAFKYLMSIGKGDHAVVNAIVGGDGTDINVELSKEWAIGFRK